MKANWKIALMCIATIAFVACKGKNTPTPPDVDPDEDFVSKVSVKDNSIAEWATLPAEFVASTTCPEEAALDALVSAKVYADKVYINILVEYDPEQIVDREWPSFHVYLDADNSDATGGYSDEFLDANSEVLLETAIFANGEPHNYNPAVFRWWGEVGGAGWAWTEHWTEEGYYQDGDGLKWGAIIGEDESPIGNSQIIDDKYIEIQLLRELIPADGGWNEDQFGIGFDIQQNWTSVGVLPIGVIGDDNVTGHANKLKVNIDKE